MWSNFETSELQGQFRMTVRVGAKFQASIHRQVGTPSCLELFSKYFTEINSSNKEYLILHYCFPLFESLATQANSYTYC